ncbi:type II secretion system F family protein [Companilactobacillus metriopterae]|uniref:type II secretion system F family protein n=1 Tax=Companilactobacillus metriopterae TaxID=1909267 RepID=UPI0013E96A49|nr:type II secretion system F family protein [Companilactobacillus metriopterae]
MGKKRVSANKKSEYLLTMSKLMKNGYSLLAAVRSLHIMTKDKIFNLIEADLEQGNSVAFAMQRLELPLTMINQFFIAEQNGEIVKTFNQCGLLLSSKKKQLDKLKELLMYPLVILFSLVIMIIGIKFYIIPQLEVDDYEFIFDILQKIVITVGVLLITFIIYFIKKLAKKTEYNKALTLIKLPIVGKVHLAFYHYLILQGIGMQMSGGTNLNQVCQMSRIYVEGSIQQELSRYIQKSLNKGLKLDVLIDNSVLIPDELKSIINLGGDNQSMARDILLMSDLKYSETTKKIKNILNLVQPVLFLVIAISIITTYLLVLLPVYGMMRGIS